MLETEIANLPNKIPLMPGTPYTLTSNINIIVGVVDEAVGTQRTGIAGCPCYALPQFSQYWSCINFFEHLLCLPLHWTLVTDKGSAGIVKKEVLERMDPESIKTIRHILRTTKI